MDTTTGTGAVWLEPGTEHQQGEWSWRLRGDEVADISYRGRRLLRGVRAVSRDADWGTRWLRATAVRKTATGVRVDVTVDDEVGSALLVGEVTVEAARSRLTVTAQLRAQAEVRTNRTGLVVLHPPHLAGTELVVTHPGGDVETTHFPRSISPHQPALEIAGLTWVDGDVEVAVGFEGDLFEMEDQRNWTDASFKTYSRPLALPFPYRLAAGEVVHQQVHVSVRATDAARTGAGSGSRQERSDHQRDTVHLVPADPFPEIALGAATTRDPAPAAAAAVGSAVLVELELDSPWWQAALARARDAGLPLDVRVVLDPRDVRHLAALDALVGGLVGTAVARIAAFDAVRHVTDRLTGAVLRSSVEAAGLDAPVVGGARSHFTQLNREQEHLAPGLDGTTFSTTPLFHAVGTEQLVESVAVQRTVAEQAVAIAGGGPVHVGPVTLRPRFNDVATTTPSATTDDVATTPATGLPEGYGAQQRGLDDVRQSAPELAAWTIASAAALAVPGVASLTYFEEWGPRGIRTADGDDLPVAAALRALADLAGGERLVGASPDGLVWAVGASTGRTTTVLSANLDARPRRLVVETPSGSLFTDLGAGAWSASTLG